MHLLWLLKLYRVQSNHQQKFCSQSIVQLNDLRLQKWYNRAVTRRSASHVDTEDALSGEGADKASKNPQQTPRRSRKKLNAETSEESTKVMASGVNREEKSAPKAPAENSKKVTRKDRKKGTNPLCYFTVFSYFSFQLALH